MKRCVCGCGQRAAQLHHVVYQQHVRRHNGDLTDDRNLAPVAWRCHHEHHSRRRPLPMHCLPGSVFEFARELMGGPAAYEYLARRYDGSDIRLQRLLHDWPAELEGGEDVTGILEALTYAAKKQAS
jgi:hypothetical protein